ncbi:MAG: hypothetical protein U0794_11940 [Isosphaeraceae bacterium]
MTASSSMRAADAIASATVAEVRAGRARMLMKGRIATPALMKAVLDGTHGLRTGRAIGQFVLMELPRANNRRLVLADTGITVHPTLEQRLSFSRAVSRWPGQRGLGLTEGARLHGRHGVGQSRDARHGRIRRGSRLDSREIRPRGSTCRAALDLAYAGRRRKRVGGSVVGAAEVMLFPGPALSTTLGGRALMYAERIAGLAGCSATRRPRSSSCGRIPRTRGSAHWRCLADPGPVEPPPSEAPFPAPLANRADAF